MPVEIEHTFKILKGREFQETTESLKIEHGPSEALKMMDGLGLSARCDEHAEVGELIFGNQTLPENFVTVTRYPNPGATTGTKLDIHEQIIFRNSEVVEVICKEYNDKLRASYKPVPKGFYPRYTSGRPV